MSNKVFLSIFVSLLNLSLRAQYAKHFNPNEQVLFSKGERLWHWQLYNAAQTKFEAIQSPTPQKDLIGQQAAFSVFRSDMLLNRNASAKAMLDFIQKNPLNLASKNPYLSLGDAYFDKGRYEQASLYYQKVNPNTLDAKGQTAFAFKAAHAYFSQNKNSEAIKVLNNAKKSGLEGTYKNEALYLLGHLHYTQSNFEDAFDAFEPLKSDLVYFEKIKPYLLRINYENKAYERTVVQAKDLLKKTNLSDHQKTELNKMIGESYFHQKKYNEAIPYLEYYKLHSKLFDASDYYQLGYAYYQKQDYDRTIENLNKIILKGGSLAQVAYYQLAYAYLRKNMRKAALSAFHSAAQMGENPAVQQDALYQYAKLGYVIGNAVEAPTLVLQRYLDKYPESTQKQEITKMLLDAYLSTGNYKAALQAISILPAPTNEVKAIEQKVAYLYGINLLKQGDYHTAKLQFERLINHTQDLRIKTKAHYWLANIAYREGDVGLALKNYEQAALNRYFLGEEDLLDYHLGYLYIKQKQWALAQKHFEAFTKQTQNTRLRNDALARLADSYYGQAKVWHALETYNQMSPQTTEDEQYIAVNKAIGYNLLGREDQQKESLKKALQNPDSKYYFDASITLSNISYKEGNPQEALNYLDVLIQKYPKTNNEAKAWAQKAWIYHNEKQNQKALEAYDYIAMNFPRTTYAMQAMDQAKKVYMELANIEAYKKWMQKLGYTPDEAQWREMQAESAEKRFNQGDYQGVVNTIASAAEKDKSLPLKALYYLAESHYLLKQTEKAEPIFEKLAFVANPHQADALLRFSEIATEKQAYQKAEQTLETLMNLPQSPHRNRALQELMLVYTHQKKYNKAIALADAVNQDNKSGQKAKDLANLVYARAQLDENNFASAKKSYLMLEASSNPKIRAEALYYRAYFKHQTGQYKASNQDVFTLASKYASHQYWGAKALLLMAKNHYALDDLYQTNYVLDNLIDHFQQYPEVFQEAKKLKNEFQKNKKR